MTPLDDFHARRRECPLVAILRGLTLHEADGIGEALVEAGIGIIEVPLNSPQPLASIEALAMRLGDRAMIGAGTVTTAAEVSAVRDAGAHALKLFPAEGAQPAMLKALRAVLPPEIPVLPVGGITPELMPQWLAAGAAGFGLGSALYRPGYSAAEVRERAGAFVAAVQAVRP